MREKAPGQSILASPSPSVPSSSGESGQQTSLVHTPSGRKVAPRKTKKMGKVTKKVILCMTIFTNASNISKAFFKWEIV